MMIEGSGSGSIYLTNGSGCGSGRPKSIRILRIRIRNTASKIRKYRGEEYGDDVSVVHTDRRKCAGSYILAYFGQAAPLFSLYVCGNCLEKCQAID